MIEVQDPARGRTFWSLGDEAIEWIEDYCVLTDSVWMGQPFRMMGWQKRLTYEIYEVDPASLRRRYRLALVGVARKNAKSELAAAITLYETFGAGDMSAKAYIAAGSDDQADITFDKCRRMITLSPDLKDAIHVPESPKANRLTLLANPYQYVERLSSKGDTKHGLNPALVVLDELHVWKTDQADELYQALTTAMAARPNGLILAITTAGEDLETSRCGALYKLGRRLEAGEIEDPSFLFRWWAAPDGMDYRSPEAWRLANPSMGQIMDEAFYRSECHRVPEADFRRLYCNHWVEYSAAPWVTAEQLESCRLEEFELDPDGPSWVGVDLAETRDAAAVSIGTLMDGEERPCGHTGSPCLYIRTKVWEAPLGPDGDPVAGWEVPHPEVRQHIRDLNASHQVVVNVFDPWHGRLMEQDLTAEGLRCERIWQSGARRSGASAYLHDLIVDGRFHWCDEAIRRHYMAAAIQPAGLEGGYYIVKRKRGRPMDAAMSGVNVAYGITWAPALEDSQPGVY